MTRIAIPEDDDALFAECDLEMFRSSGPGGQNVNRRETAVRLTHRPTGIVVTCQEERSQWLNRVRALEKLRARLERLNQKRRPRIATRVPHAARAKRLTEKKKRGEAKTRRNKPRTED